MGLQCAPEVTWYERSVRALVVADKMEDGRLPISPEGVAKVLFELRQCAFIGRAVGEQEKRNPILGEIYMAIEAMEEWDRKFRGEKWRTKLVRIPKVEGHCSVCNRQLRTGYYLSIEFFIADLDLWNMEYVSHPVGRVCVKSAKDPFNLQVRGRDEIEDDS